MTIMVSISGASPVAYWVTLSRVAIISRDRVPSTTVEPCSIIVDIVKSGTSARDSVCPARSGDPPGLAIRLTAVMPK